MLSFPLHFNIKKNILVTVSKIFKDVFDFEFMMANGSKRTFRWKENSTHVYRQRNGRIDEDIREAIGIFLKKLRNQ